MIGLKGKGHDGKIKLNKSSKVTGFFHFTFSFSACLLMDSGIGMCYAANINTFRR